MLFSEKEKDKECSVMETYGKIYYDKNQKSTKFFAIKEGGGRSELYGLVPNLKVFFTPSLREGVI